MDAEKSILDSGDSLPNKDKVLRIVLNTERDRRNKIIPAIRCFTLSAVDKIEGFKLSVDWDQKTTPEETLIRVGLTFRGSGPEYKDHSNREVFAINIDFLRGLDGIIDVIYNPIFNDPPINGRPNNIAHSLVEFRKEDYDQYEAQIFTEIRSYAMNSKLIVDMNFVNEQVTNLRV